MPVNDLVDIFVENDNYVIANDKYKECKEWSVYGLCFKGIEGEMC